MPLYKYKYTKDGEEKEETKEFDSKAALYSMVRANEGSILFVEEVGEKQVALKIFSFRKKIKAQEVIIFAKNLSVMIDAGLSVSRSLIILEKQLKNKNFIEILKSVGNSVNSGETLSNSLARHPDIFSNLFVSMVPTLTETFKGLEIELPLPTRVIIAISDFLRVNIILVLVAVVVVIFGFLSGLKTKKGKYVLDFIILHFPMIKTMAKEVNAARTARTLASLISSGVDIVAAI